MKPDHMLIWQHTKTKGLYVVYNNLKMKIPGVDSRGVAYYAVKKNEEGHYIAQMPMYCRTEIDFKRKFVPHERVEIIQHHEVQE